MIKDIKLKKLPIGISTLRTIIQDNYLYVDKTKIALDLINGDGRYFFLSRPRRFGKSLFLDTLRTIFEGDKEVFKGLYIYDKYDFVKYPIIRISFNDGDFSSKESFRKTILNILKENQNNLDLECQDKENASFCFRELIINANKKYKQQVIILVDEYDKPILDNIENPDVARILRDELKNFYSVIKGADEYLRFVFITGVSKFSKVSLFSGLNNINDITLDKSYSTICGYTQNDVETSFKEHLKGQDFNKIRKWYNGYKFLGEGVYNPFDILLFIQKGFVYHNYWFATATPTFLLKLIEKSNYFLPNLENIVKDERMLNSFDVDYIELETLMWQTGYLTITHTQTVFDSIQYHLGIPNQEVRQSLLGSVADFMTKNHNTLVNSNHIKKALFTQDFDTLVLHLKALYASIPYNLFTKNDMHTKEGYYVSVFYSYMKALGFDLIGEDCTNKGRIDLTIKLTNSIYIIEFKVDGTSALAQIKEKNYHEKYLDKDLPIYLLGIEFDTKSRNISKIVWERVEK